MGVRVPLGVLFSSLLVIPNNKSYLYPMKKIYLIISLLLMSIVMNSQTKQRESYYQKIFAEAINGETEVILSDRARVDILTDEYAIEVDFAYKWAESIGQSLYYAEMTGKRAGVLLIINGDKDTAQINRLMKIAVKYNITVWLMDYSDEDKYCEVLVTTKYEY